MNPIEKAALEEMAAGMLSNEQPIAVTKIGELRKKGYDLNYLRDMVRAYASLHCRERRLVITLTGANLIVSHPIPIMFSDGI